VHVAVSLASRHPHPDLVGAGVRGLAAEPRGKQQVVSARRARAGLPSMNGQLRVPGADAREERLDVLGLEVAR
jgi:hypothetical protein